MSSDTKLKRVSVSLTQAELDCIDRYRKGHRLSRSAALRIVAMEYLREMREIDVAPVPKGE